MSTSACPLLISKGRQTGRHYKFRVLSELTNRARKKNFCYSSQLHKHTTLLGQVSLSNEISRCEVLCINANLCLYKGGIQNPLLQRGGKISSPIERNTRRNLTILSQTSGNYLTYVGVIKILLLIADLNPFWNKAKYNIILKLMGYYYLSSNGMLKNSRCFQQSTITILENINHSELII